MWQATLAVVGIVTAGAWPLWQHTQKRSAESAAAEFIEYVSGAQERFRGAYGAFAADLRSLTEPCAGGDPLMDGVSLAKVRGLGYHVHVRPATGARLQQPDCHGRATTSDYYASVTPASPGGLAQRAYARRGIGEAFVFFDGVAPQERDFQPGGLATPLRQLNTFTIP